jgi:hypothetical protein
MGRAGVALLALPTLIRGYLYEPWDGPRVPVDTALATAVACVGSILAALGQ